MNKSSNTCWTDALSLIKSNVSPQHFDTWFKPIVFDSFDEKTKALTIKVASTFVCEYLEENFGNLLFKVLTKTFGPGVVLKYRILADKEHHITNDEERVLDPDAASAKKPQAATPFDVEVPRQLDAQLNPKQTFANFIEGESNKFSRAMGLSIAEHPTSTQFNPLFIYGPSGCGKTHLLNAIGLRTKQLYPQKRVLYISARLFQVQFQNATRQNATPDFINFYQTIDLLIIDDVQEWSTATRTQETFFHIFNHLFRNGKRIILASDRPPVELKGMNERLITRFAGGLTTEMERPNVQLCVDILNSKIRRDGLDIPQDVVRFIAETSNGSIRELEGVINSLLAYSVVYNCEISMELCQRVIKRTVRHEKKQPSVDEIINAVCQHFNISAEAINGPSRKRELVEARQVSMYMAQKLTKTPTTRIGKMMGGRDHSTVLHSCAKVEDRLTRDVDFRTELQAIEKSVKHKR